MSSTSGGGAVSASLMFIPLLAVPFLAAFGLPQFSPVAASSTSSPDPDPVLPEDPGVGESRRYTADDLFVSFDAERAANPVNTAPGPSATVDASRETWNDPFGEVAGAASPSDPSAAPPSTPRAVPNAVFDDWPSDTTTTPHRSPAHRAAPSPAPDAFADPGSDAFPFDAPPQNSPANVANDRVTAEVPAAGATRAGEPPATPARSAAPLSWQDAVRRLNDLGINDFLLRPGERDAQFHFTCTYPDPANPGQSQRFEAEATDPLQAVTKVLQQIDRVRAGVR